MLRQFSEESLSESVMSDPDFSNEEFMALVFKLVCERLAILPGIDADESLQKLQEFGAQMPQKANQIDEAVIYASKEAMVRWTMMKEELMSRGYSSGERDRMISH